jgi:hypothetical protein
VVKELIIQLGAQLPVAVWEAFFAQRPYYTVMEAEGGEGLDALYENPDTEVSFAFRWRGGSASFELGRQRPRPFVGEAEAEVAAFAARFKIAWPMGELVRRWEVGRRKSGARGAVPAPLVEQVWRWNRDRLALAASLELFVPRIAFAKAGRQVKTLVEWAPDVAAAVPKVDLLWVELPGDGRLVSVAKVAGLLDAFPSSSGEGEALPFWKVGEGGPPEELLKVMARLPKGKALLKVALAEVKEK